MNNKYKKSYEYMIYNNIQCIWIHIWTKKEKNGKIKYVYNECIWIWIFTYTTGFIVKKQCNELQTEKGK